MPLQEMLEAGCAAGGSVSLRGQDFIACCQTGRRSEDFEVSSGVK